MDKLHLQAEEVEAQCETHGKYRAQRMQIAGRKIVGSCPECEEAARQEREAERRRVELERWIAASGIPRRFQGMGLASYQAELPGQKRALSVAEKLVKAESDGASAIFCGKPGTGKSMLGCAVVRAFIESRRSARFGTVLSALRSIKDTYRRDSETSETAAMAALLRPTLLVLDEVGVQLGTEHEKLLLFEIINERYQECRSTILISNLTREEIGEYLGQRVMDRFAETGAVVAFDWESYRGKRKA